MKVTIKDGCIRNGYSSTAKELAEFSARSERKENIMGPKFPLGQVVSTPGALDALTSANLDSWDILSRHVAGDWGDLNESDRHENEHSLKDGGRLLSAYALSTGIRIWIITEADRSSTCILLPEEY